MLRYKYIPFTNNSLKIFSEGTIKYSIPSKVNDPFDCFPVHKGDDSEEFVKSRPDLMQKASRIRKININKLLRENPASRIQDVKENGTFSRELSDRVGICSLTRDPLNLLMWSHYAQSHAGFVVEFNIPEETYNPRFTPRQIARHLFPFEVYYQLKRPIVCFNDDVGEQVDKQFLTKSLVWKYEQEERVVDFARGSGIHTFNQNVLRSVFAGANIDKSDFDDLGKEINSLNAQKGLHVSLHKVELDPKKYELFIPTRPDLAQTHFQ
jgi:hypothetical protein